MSFLRMLQVQLRQVFHWKLIACALAFAIIQIGGAAGTIIQREYVSVWYMAQVSMSSGAFYVTFFILPAIPFSMTLAQDMEAHATPYWLIRGGVRTYVLCKLLASALAGALTIGLGWVFFIFANSFSVPMFGTGTACEYDVLFQSGRIAAGWLYYILHFALSGALIGMFSTFLTIFISNPIAAVAMPLSIFLTLVRLVNGLASDMESYSIWYPYSWISNIHHAPTPGQILLEKMIMVTVFCALMCLSGCVAMKRRVERV